MTYKIKIEINFRAGHRLLPPYEGKCNNVHGEGYTAIIEFYNDYLDDNGMVLDFGEIKKNIKKFIDENWDHSYMHHEKDIIGKILKENCMKTYNMGDKNPTAENIAFELFMFIKHNVNQKVSSVGIVESFKDSVAYYEEPFEKKISFIHKGIYCDDNGEEIIEKEDCEGEVYFDEALGGYMCSKCAWNTSLK
jgi:6-pyruvoyltetrahydropterin/6-carboxytetrahydropterin synthase